MYSGVRSNTPALTDISEPSLEGLVFLFAFASLAFAVSAGSIHFETSPAAVKSRKMSDFHSPIGAKRQD